MLYLGESRNYAPLCPVRSLAAAILSRICHEVSDRTRIARPFPTRLRTVRVLWHFLTWPILLVNAIINALGVISQLLSRGHYGTPRAIPWCDPGFSALLGMSPRKDHPVSLVTSCHSRPLAFPSGFTVYARGI